MRVALIKQVLDVFGPWSSVRWEDTNAKKLFDIWPSKATYWEMTCLLKADWYVVTNPQSASDYIETIRKRPELLEVVSKYTRDIVEPSDIPFEDYDVVITLDPVLKVPHGSKTLFAYYMQEHWDRLYTLSLHRPIGNYDLFLAHMLDADPELKGLPQALSFPYLYTSEATRSILDVSEKEEAVWADWRVLTMLGMCERWDTAAEAAAKRLEEVLRLPVRYKGSFDKTRTPLGIADPPSWGDALRYLEALAHCKYYIGVGRDSGAGQGLCDAASVGCICIGSVNRPYHRLVCHPDCLCSDLFDLPRLVSRVAASTDLQQEALAWQEEALRRYFADKPLQLLEKAVALKRQSLWRR
jgi:hypothetical protein